jgi:lysylphosphatidylglycerol synthetase-like protein (DUF2156 family)
MKQCPHCGFLADDKKAICPDCQASIENEPLHPEPPRQQSKGALIFNVVFGLLTVLLAFFFRSWVMLAAAALFSMGLWCLTGLLAFRDLSLDDGDGLVALLSAIGVLLTAVTVVFGGCGYLSWSIW